MEPRYEFVLDGGSLYVHKWMGVASSTTVVPLSMALMSCELLTCCKELLAFIKAHDMGGAWCQESYPAIRNAKGIVRKAEAGDLQWTDGRN